MKKITTAALYCACIVGFMYSNPVMANTEQEDDGPRLVSAYGDNPNIAHVLAYKAQESVIQAAQKVSDATDKGVAKIKPSVDHAWESTKAFTQRNTARLKNGSANSDKTEKSEYTPPNNTGAAPIIQQQSLSQNSSESSRSRETQSSSTTTTYAVTDL